MNMNRTRILIICLTATLIMSGLVTTIGFLTEPAAEQYGVKITEIASQFSWLIAGFSIGYVLSFFVFDYISMKRIIISCYSVATTAVLLIHFFPAYSLLAGLFLVIGTCSGIIVCAAGTLIARLWQGNTRQSVLVAQDAVFNGGGVGFAWLVPLLLASGYAWSITWMVVAGIYLAVIMLALLSSFSEGEISSEEDSQAGLTTEWNSGFILIGVSLFLFLFAKIALFVWAPQFVEQKFSASGAESGHFMSNIFTAAMFGSVAGVYVVSKINVKYVLYALVVLAMLSTWLFTLAQNIDVMFLIAFLFGISISATYNSYIAFGLSFVKIPNHKHIAYLSLMGGVGSALGPLVSSKFVEMQSDKGAAITLCFITYVAVFLILLVANTINKLNKPAVS
jgi:MFS transporter, TsgA protein